MRGEPRRRRARTVWSTRGQNATPVRGAPPELGCRRGLGDRQAGPAMGVRTEERKVRLSLEKDAPFSVTGKEAPGTGGPMAGEDCDPAAMPGGSDRTRCCESTGSYSAEAKCDEEGEVESVEGPD